MKTTNDNEEDDMARINFGGTWEEVTTAEEFTLERARRALADETVAVIGYGVQGPGQALNLRDNAIRVIVGQREGTGSWVKAVADGFDPGGMGCATFRCEGTPNNTRASVSLSNSRAARMS